MISTKYFDHTILKADATEEAVAKICAEALEYDFASVCVNQYYTKFVAEKLAGSNVKVCTVVGFPLGMSDTRVKAFETKAAIEDGATEIDMVINVGALKDGKYDYVLNEESLIIDVAANIDLTDNQKRSVEETIKYNLGVSNITIQGIESVLLEIISE